MNTYYRSVIFKSMSVFRYSFSIATLSIHFHFVNLPSSININPLILFIIGGRVHNPNDPKCFIDFDSINEVRS